MFLYPVSISYVLAALLHIFPLLGRAAGNYPLGISFGPSQISAAYISDSGESIIVANFTGNDQYQALTADCAVNEGLKVQRFKKWYRREGETLVPTSPDADQNPEVEETIAWALRRLRKEVDAKLLERRRDMTSIVVPQYFNDTISKAVFNAVAASEPLVTKPQQVRKYYNAARLAYRLDTCEGLGLASSECDAELEDGPHLVFFVDLNNRLLELSIFDMDHNTCSEVVRKTLISATSRLEEETNPHYKVLDIEVRQFVQQNLRQGDTYHDLDFLRAIIVGGDASSREIERTVAIIRDILPDHAYKIRNHIYPHYLGAAGAAAWAKKQVEHPDLLADIFRGTMIEEHDEL